MGGNSSYVSTGDKRLDYLRTFNSDIQKVLANIVGKGDKEKFNDLHLNIILLVTDDRVRQAVNTYLKTNNGAKTQELSAQIIDIVKALKGK